MSIDLPVLMILRNDAFIFIINYTWNLMHSILFGMLCMNIKVVRTLYTFSFYPCFDFYWHQILHSSHLFAVYKRFGFHFPLLSSDPSSSITHILIEFDFAPFLLTRIRISLYLFGLFWYFHIKWKSRVSLLLLLLVMLFRYGFRIVIVTFIITYNSSEMKWWNSLQYELTISANRVVRFDVV